jgi:hypothetical protein
MDKDWIKTAEAAALLGISLHLWWHRVNRGLILPLAGGGRGTTCYWSKKEVLAKRDILCRIPDQPFRHGATPEECIYLAGLFDGEGSVTIFCHRAGRRQAQHCMTIMISNTYRPVMDWLVEAFGGCLSHRKVHGNRRPGFTWIAQGMRAYHILTIMRPHLKIKMEQADAGIEFQEDMILHWGEHYSKPVPDAIWEKRQAIKERMNHLNRRGPR